VAISWPCAARVVSLGNVPGFWASGAGLIIKERGVTFDNLDFIVGQQKLTHAVPEPSPVCPEGTFYCARHERSGVGRGKREWVPDNTAPLPRAGAVGATE